MSVPTGKRTEGKLAVAMNAKNLVLYTLHITDNEKEFPIGQNKDFIPKIRSLATDIFSKVWASNNILVNNEETKKKRLQLQQDACIDCNTLLPMIEIACALYHQPSKRLKYWTSLVVEVRNQIRAWRESDMKRYKEI